MRRLVALLSAVELVASLAGSASATGAMTRSSSFVGNFVLLDGTNGQAGEALGQLSAKVSMPTDSKLVPGNFDFKGSPGNPLLQAHGQISFAGFYYDPNHEPSGGTIDGAYVAYGEYASCDYRGPNDASCSLGAVWFIDCVDPSVRNEVAFGNTKDATGGWIPEYWSIRRRRSPSSSTLHPAADRQEGRRTRLASRLRTGRPGPLVTDRSPPLRSRTRDPALWASSSGSTGPEAG